jgi:hypothetical protein
VAARGQGGTRRCGDREALGGGGGEGGAGNREARGGGGQGGAHTGGPRRARGIIVGGCIQYRECTRCILMSSYIYIY